MEVIVVNEKDLKGTFENLFGTITALGVFIPQTRVISMIMILFEKISPVLADILRIIANNGELESVIFAPSKNQVISFFERFDALNQEVNSFDFKTKKKLYKDFLYGGSLDEIRKTYNLSQKAIDEVSQWKEQLIEEFVSDFQNEVNSNMDNLLIGDILNDGVLEVRSALNSVINLNVRKLTGKRGQVKLKKIIQSIYK